MSNKANVSGHSGLPEAVELSMLACIHPIVPTMRLVNIDTNMEKLQLAYRKGGV